MEEKSMISYRVFLDTNVFVFSEVFPESNSKIIVDLATKGEIIVVVTESLIEEVRGVFQNLYDRQVALTEVYFIRTLPKRIEITESKIDKNLKSFQVNLKDFDLRHFVAARVTSVDYLVTTDKDFFTAEIMKEIKVIKPKDFIKVLGIKPYEIDY